MASSGLNVLPPWLFKSVVDDVLISRSVLSLNLICLAVVAIFALKAVTSYWQQYLMNEVGQSVVMDVRRLSHLLGLVAVVTHALAAPPPAPSAAAARLHLLHRLPGTDHAPRGALPAGLGGAAGPALHHHTILQGCRSFTAVLLY